jgi:DNA-binding NarL/FixJ family response regulator
LAFAYFLLNLIDFKAMPKTKEKTKVVIVDDHKLFRNGLKFILGEIEGIEVVGEASNGKEFLELLNYIKPGLIIMDISMPEMNGIDACRIALENNPDLKILILSMFGEDAYYNTMIEMGVKGFILKDSDTSELRNAVTSIINGQSYFSQELLLKLIRNKSAGPAIKLSKRENEILTLICKGLSTLQISDQLHISHRTVERHRASLLEKTDSSNSISMAIFAIKNNLISIN